MMICASWLAHMFSSLNLVTDGCGQNWPPCIGPFFFFGIPLKPGKEGGLKSATVGGGRREGLDWEEE